MIKRLFSPGKGKYWSCNKYRVLELSLAGGGVFLGLWQAGTKRYDKHNKLQWMNAKKFSIPYGAFTFRRLISQSFHIHLFIRYLFSNIPFIFQLI
jgi:hypothetical protein